jgi:hypothetical protein
LRSRKLYTIYIVGLMRFGSFRILRRSIMWIKYH